MKATKRREALFSRHVGRENVRCFLCMYVHIYPFIVFNGYGPRYEVRGHSLAMHVQFLLHCSVSPPKKKLPAWCFPCWTERSGAAGKRRGSLSIPLTHSTQSTDHVPRNAGVQQTTVTHAASLFLLPAPLPKLVAFRSAERRVHSLLCGLKTSREQPASSC